MSENIFTKSVLDTDSSLTKTTITARNLSEVLRLRDAYPSILPVPVIKSQKLLPLSSGIRPDLINTPFDAISSSATRKTPNFRHEPRYTTTIKTNFSLPGAGSIQHGPSQSHEIENSNDHPDMSYTIDNNATRNEHLRINRLDTSLGVKPPSLISGTSRKSARHGLLKPSITESQPVDNGLPIPPLLSSLEASNSEVLQNARRENKNEFLILKSKPHKTIESSALPVKVEGHHNLPHDIGNEIRLYTPNESTHLKSERKIVARIDGLTNKSPTEFIGSESEKRELPKDKAAKLKPHTLAIRASPSLVDIPPPMPATAKSLHRSNDKLLASQRIYSSVEEPDAKNLESISNTQGYLLGFHQQEFHENFNEPSQYLESKTVSKALRHKSDTESKLLEERNSDVHDNIETPPDFEPACQINLNPVSSRSGSAISLPLAAYPIDQEPIHQEYSYFTKNIYNSAVKLNPDLKATFSDSEIKAMVLQPSSLDLDPADTVPNKVSLKPRPKQQESLKARNARVISIPNTTPARDSSQSIIDGKLPSQQNSTDTSKHSRPGTVKPPIGETSMEKQKVKLRTSVARSSTGSLVAEKSQSMMNILLARQLETEEDKLFFKDVVNWLKDLVPNTNAYESQLTAMPPRSRPDVQKAEPIKASDKLQKVKMLYDGALSQEPETIKTKAHPLSDNIPVVEQGQGNVDSESFANTIENLETLLNEALLIAGKATEKSASVPKKKPYACSYPNKMSRTSHMNIKDRLKKKNIQLNPTAPLSDTYQENSDDIHNPDPLPYRVNKTVYIPRKRLDTVFSEVYAMNERVGSLKPPENVSNLNIPHNSMEKMAYGLEETPQESFELKLRHLPSKNSDQESIGQESLRFSSKPSPVGLSNLEIDNYLDHPEQKDEFMNIPNYLSSKKQKIKNNNSSNSSIEVQIGADPDPWSKIKIPKNGGRMNKRQSISVLRLHSLTNSSLPRLNRPVPKKQSRRSRKNHVSLRDNQLKGSDFFNNYTRQTIARDWSPVRKRLVALVACLSTALIGILVGIYAGETPAIQYYIVDFHHYTVLGNVFFFLGLAIPTFFAWPLPLLHGRKPYILGAMSIALPLLFPQALAVGNMRSPYVSTWRVGLILSRTMMGFFLGFANMNFKAMLTDLFGASLQSTNPHQEFADKFDVRRHGGGMGIWLGLWTWSTLGSIGLGFFIGSTIIDTLPPSWGLYISIIIIAFVMLLNVVCPEVRRSAFRRSMAEVVTKNVLSHRLARGEVKMHMVKSGPKWWGEELYYGIILSKKMLQQPGFLVLSLYVAWIYGQQVLIITLLAALMSKDYNFRSPIVGLSVMAIPFGALFAIPFQKASLFSRSRRTPPVDDDGTLSKRKIHWSSHMLRRAIFVLILPIFGIIFTISTNGPSIPFIVPVLSAGVIGFLSGLAMAECHGIIMETFDTSDLQPGMTGRPRGASGEKTAGKRTNFSSFPRINSAVAITETFGYIFAAGATGIGGVLTRRLGQQAATGVMAGILFILSILLLIVLLRFTEVQIIPESKLGEMSRYQARRASQKRRDSGEDADDEPWRPVIIGNPHQSTRRMCLLELGSLSRYSEIRKRNRLIDKMSFEAAHPNRNAMANLERKIKEKEADVRRSIIRSMSQSSFGSRMNHRKSVRVNYRKSSRKGSGRSEGNEHSPLGTLIDDLGRGRHLQAEDYGKDTLGVRRITE
ncbi:MFS transporter [Blumeria hordei DH14]|uniref:MFS transporter n=1 Tax=Blumeria graminis f. sp. hordei (strain DH14) TaxID=546991 RepID=N1J8Q7_BLUG1|nr:MFS transporter [Blumeria hordei DH14]